MGERRKRREMEREGRERGREWRGTCSKVLRGDRRPWPPYHRALVHCTIGTARCYATDAELQALN